MSIPRKHTLKSAKSGALQCVTLDLGLDGFRECPQVGPLRCEFAMPFGYGFLCKHPIQTAHRAGRDTRAALRQVPHEQ